MLGTNESTSLVRDNANSFDPPGRWWFTPAFFILAPVGMSFIMWMVFVGLHTLGYLPGSSEDLIGFSEPATINVRNVFLLSIWYGAVVSIAMLGWRLAAVKRARPKATLTTDQTFERHYFLLILSAAGVGVIYSYYKIAGTNSIFASLQNQTANDFSSALSGFAGPQTLRYATILAAPLGIYLWRKKAIRWPYMTASILLLVLNAAITSRLSLLMATFVYIVLWVRSSGPRTTIRTFRPQRTVAVVATVLILFAILSALNYVRNANYYRDAGVSNPIAMNVYQMGTYLAVPAQVSLAVADAIVLGTWERSGDPVDSLAAVEPTFLQFQKVSKSAGKTDADYGYSVEIGPTLITNSVFADTYADYGVWGWIYAIGAYGLAGYLFGRLSRSPAIIGASAGIIGYSFSEVWRAQLLNTGIVSFLLLLTIGSAGVATVTTRRQIRSNARQN